jgi:hypothetical protein
MTLRDSTQSRLADPPAVSARLLQKSVQQGSATRGLTRSRRSGHDLVNDLIRDRQ